MVVSIKIVGAKQVSRKMLNLGPQLDKMISKTSGEFLRSVARGAKIRAPRLTGALAQSIKVTQGSKKGDWKLSVGEGLRHALPLENSYKPHLVNSSAMAYPGKTIAQVYGIPEGIWLFVRGPSSGQTHFIRDALQSAIPRLPSMLDKAAKQAIKQS